MLSNWNYSQVTFTMYIKLIYFYSVIFAGFSSDSVASRILDANCKLVITSDGVINNFLIFIKKI